MSALESARDIARRLLCKSREDALDRIVEHAEPRCFCGEKMISKSFYGWGRKPVCEGATMMEDGIIRMIGLSCPIPGCEGNVAEKSESYADAKLKENDLARHLNGIDRQFLWDCGIES